MILSRGQRLPLETLVGASPFSLAWKVQGLGVDASVFGLDDQERLSDDRYMIFFNQPVSPCGGLRLENDRVEVSLARLPSSLKRLVLVLSVDGPGVFHDVTAGSLVIQAPGHESRFDFSGATFAQERALMLAEIYRKDGNWRIGLSAQGFNGGLDAVVRHFGGVVAEESRPDTSRVSLEKRVAAEAPHLVNLTKKVSVSLEKTGLASLRARVGLVLDATGSMRKQYKEGKIQALLDRLLPLALRFDDDGALDVWAFDDRQTRLPPMSLANCRDYVAHANGGWRAWVGGANDEPPIMRDVLDHYEKDPSRLPIYILFVSDGGVRKNREIKELITNSSSRPLFWQFMGLGGKNYGVLEQLDTLGQGGIDNCGFFAIDDLHDLSDEAFYDRLLQEFPLWLKVARKAGIVQDNP
ncbi:VWA domain-containing protein [Pararhodospirillum oryzae]|uniref:Tellurium resistance protein n=1 Tax=Pararhodospirillum oryzae TaxID=478448 RepID=A0A512H684_9PROT|nr:VWA domain-containing protein [Pararhodospirillum oryzae]GEO80944.1 tellurium resistance protein [Pararhodospirillum oryzae]